MPRYKNKHTLRDRKLVRRGASVRKVGIGKSLMTYNNPKLAFKIKRTGVIEVAPLNFGSETQRAYNFQLAQVPGFAELVALFDSYRIDKVKIVLRPYKSDTLQVPDSTIYNMPRVYHVIDYDDDTALSIAALQEYSNCKNTVAKYSVKRWLVPKLAQTVYRTGVSSAYSTPEKSMKLDCAYTDVPHYGFKWAATPTGGAVTTTFGYEVIVDYYMSFFGIR